MTRSAPRYSPPAVRARRAARDPFVVRLGLLVLAGVIVTPIAAVIARDGGEVVQAGNLPGAAVALEPAAESTTVAPEPVLLPSAGTIPATVPPAGTLPATIAPPTTTPATPAPAAAEASAQAAAPAGDSGGSGGSPGGGGLAPTAAPAPAATAPPTTAPPPPPPPPPTQPPRGSWAEAQIIQIIRDVFPDDIEEKALAIAHRESRFDPYAQNFCCTGLFQIYGDVHQKLINSLGFRVDQLTDPLVNCVVALALYQRSGWAPWGG
jgi:hypothetical protein